MKKAEEECSVDTGVDTTVTIEFISLRTVGCLYVLQPDDCLVLDFLDKVISPCIG